MRTLWAHISCNISTLLHILLQHHPLGSLSEFRDSSLIALQQRSPQGIPLGPHFFNHGDTLVDRRSRRISHLIHRATGLQIPGSPLPFYPYPCQDPTSHPARTCTSRRPECLNELIRSNSFVLTIYTIPYPQGHSGLQIYGNPLAWSPFLFDKEDLSPVYNLMHQSFTIACTAMLHLGQHFSPPPHTTRIRWIPPLPPPWNPVDYGPQNKVGEMLCLNCKMRFYTTRTRHRIYASPAPS